MSIKWTDQQIIILINVCHEIVGHRIHCFLTLLLLYLFIFCADLLFVSTDLLLITRLCFVVAALQISALGLYLVVLHFAWPIIEPIEGLALT